MQTCVNYVDSTDFILNSSLYVVTYRNVVFGFSSKNEKMDWISSFDQCFQVQNLKFGKKAGYSSPLIGRIHTTWIISIFL